MICSKCQTVNPDDAVFCEECGARMPSEGTVVCPKCQTVNPADTVFCEECGQEIQASNGMTPEQIASYTKKKYGQELCPACAAKKKEASHDA